MARRTSSRSSWRRQETGSLLSLVVKEIKELVRDPKILIGVILMPLIMFPVMGQSISISQKSMMQAMITASFAIYDEDQGQEATELKDYLYRNNTVITVEADSFEDALIDFQETNATALLYIREGYSENVSDGLKGNLKIYANLKTMTIAETSSSDSLSSLVNIYSYYSSISRIQNLLIGIGEVGDPYVVRNPLSISYASIIKGNVLEIAPGSIVQLIMTQSVMLPLMVMVMLMFAIQMAATSIAIEKEQKTLETLMTLPVGRMTILSGKLAGSIVVAVGGAISYMIGFSYYMTSAFSFAPEAQARAVGVAGLEAGAEREHTLIAARLRARRVDALDPIPGDLIAVARRLRLDDDAAFLAGLELSLQELAVDKPHLARAAEDVVPLMLECQDVDVGRFV